jgi:hypothetical protein
MSKKNFKNTMTRGLGLLALLVVLFFLMSKIDLAADIFEAVFTPRQFDFAALAATDSLRNEYYNLVAGFWEHSSDSLNDRIEIKDNGIIWRYTERIFTLPQGKIDSIARVSTGFLIPMRFGENNLALSDFRIFREVWFMPDTCFGRSDTYVVARTTFSNDSLFFDGAAYTRYEGELRDFFPAGSIGILQPSIETMTMRSCGKINHVAHWLRRNIAESFHEREIPYDMLKFEQEQLLRRYYIPLCLSRIEVAMEPGEEFDVDLRIIISPDGSVDSCIVRSRRFISAASRLPIVNEVKEWRFPADGQNSDTLQFIGRVIKKQ